MNQSFQKFTLIFMQFSIGKKIKNKNSKFGFQKRKPDFGFKTENRISGFQLTSLLKANSFIYNFLLNDSLYNEERIQKCRAVLHVNLNTSVGLIWAYVKVKK